MVERLLAKGVPDDIELKKWAFRVCKNLWIDTVRKQRVRSVDQLDEERVPPEVGCGEHQAVLNINLQEVNKAMNSLPDDQRICLTLAAVAGLSYAEIAETLAVPVGTVMSRISRARAALANIFNDGSKLNADTGPGGIQHDLH